VSFTLDWRAIVTSATTYMVGSPSEASLVKINNDTKKGLSRLTKLSIENDMLEKLEYKNLINS
jgi:hypothetical protein